MQLPSWVLRRPGAAPDAVTTTAFDALLDAALAAGPDRVIEYTLPAPRWQFLAHVAERRGYLLHGSGNPDIARFEPREAADSNPFGRQVAVYAAADGIWPIFFAIIDSRRVHPGILVSGCLHVPGEAEPLYFFSIGRAVLERGPWREGTVYILPNEGFEPEPPVTIGRMQARTSQLACHSAVAPLAKVRVAPEDFPFLDQVRAHDDTSTIARAESDPLGFPWLDPADDPGTEAPRPQTM